MKSRRTSAALAAAFLLFAALSASAQIRGRNGCRIGNPGNIDFGEYLDGQTTPALSVLTIVLSCKGDSVTVDAVVTGGPGENSGDMLDRRLRAKDGYRAELGRWTGSGQPTATGPGPRSRSGHSDDGGGGDGTGRGDRRSGR